MVEERVSKEFVDKTVEFLSEFHDLIIDESGGTKGIRDIGGLHNSVYKILRYRKRHQDEPASVGAFVYEELARRHHFNDANKRTAHAFAKFQLFFMGTHLKVKYKDAVPFIIEIAKHQSAITFNQVKEWVKLHLSELSHDNVEKYIKETILDITYGYKK
ncbi:type II toxin-antitoxin system death-on-curing family toxin [Candidatus Woesearchaeota archaeon]|nr:type II toxin-antitoxin system death-on-curing family toxin [Candidatus Woesearchaeota archaeon]MBI2582103.1 type II toxin-antitoxin system death-on-curing family toxin [Candidatus Woesearchaeota archaeon]